MTGCLGLLATQVMCQEFSQCYNINNLHFCLWTNGSKLKQAEAQTACLRRSSFLPRITNFIIQSKLAEFRSAAGNLLLGNYGFWIDVRAVGIDNFHWINGSQLEG